MLDHCRRFAGHTQRAQSRDERGQGLGIALERAIDHCHDDTVELAQRTNAIAFSDRDALAQYFIDDCVNIALSLAPALGISGLTFSETRMHGWPAVAHC